MPNNQHVPDNFGTNYGITYTGNVVTYMQRVRNSILDNRAFNQTKNMMERRAAPSHADYLNNGLIGGVSTILGGGEYSFKWNSKNLSRKWSYQISQFSGAPKSGKIYQGWKQLSKNSAKWGQRFGYTGTVLSTIDYISNFDKATTGKHTNYWLSTSLFALSVFPPTAPVFAPIGFIYGAAQFGTFINSGKSIEENWIDP